MTYVALLNWDYTDGLSNERNRLANAICQCPGWSYAETSAFIYEGDDLSGFQMGLEVLARAVSTPGHLSALNMNVQWIDPPNAPPAANFHRRALDNITRDFPLPTEW